MTKFLRKDLDLRERAKEGGIRKAANLTKKNGEFGDLTKSRRKDLDLRERAKEGGIRKAANLTKTANLAKLGI